LTCLLFGSSLFFLSSWPCRKEERVTPQSRGVVYLAFSVHVSF